MSDDPMYRYGEIVETIKGAKFWGKVIGLHLNDGERPGLTVEAIHPEFAGLRHIYPIGQLQQSQGLTLQPHVMIGYTNWKGEYGIRRIVPMWPWFKATEWHPEPQWLLHAFDLAKMAERDFAIKDIGVVSP